MIISTVEWLIQPNTIMYIANVFTIIGTLIAVLSSRNQKIVKNYTVIIL